MGVFDVLQRLIGAGGTIESAFGWETRKSRSLLTNCLIRLSLFLVASGVIRLSMRGAILNCASIVSPCNVGTSTRQLSK